jgi:hypothetical protein
MNVELTAILLAMTMALPSLPPMKGPSNILIINMIGGPGYPKGWQVDMLQHETRHHITYKTGE